MKKMTTQANQGRNKWSCSVFLPAAQRLSLIVEIVGVVGGTFFQFSLFYWVDVFVCCLVLTIGYFYHFNSFLTLNCTFSQNSQFGKFETVKLQKLEIVAILHSNKRSVM